MKQTQSRLWAYCVYTRFTIVKPFCFTVSCGIGYFMISLQTEIQTILVNSMLENLGQALNFPIFRPFIICLDHCSTEIVAIDSYSMVNITTETIQMTIQLTLN